jgi:hypothetical protein
MALSRSCIVGRPKPPMLRNVQETRVRKGVVLLRKTYDLLRIRLLNRVL